MRLCCLILLVLIAKPTPRPRNPAGGLDQFNPLSTESFVGFFF